MTSLTIVGNVCAEPESRKTNSGLEITELRIASNEGKDKTVFWSVKFIGNKAGEVASKYAKKGSLVAVTGRVDEENWEKDGVKKSKLYCIADSFTFIGGKSDGAAVKKETQKVQEEDGSQNEVPF